MTEGENAMDSCYIWWKREDACRFGNGDITGSGTLTVQHMYLSGKVCVHPLSGYKHINLNMELS